MASWKKLSKRGSGQAALAFNADWRADPDRVNCAT